MFDCHLFTEDYRKVEHTIISELQFILELDCLIFMLLQPLWTMANMLSILTKLASYIVCFVLNSQDAI